MREQDAEEEALKDRIRDGVRESNALGCEDRSCSRAARRYELVLADAIAVTSSVVKLFLYSNVDGLV